MTDYMTQRRLLALCAVEKVDWHVIAREAQKANGIERLIEGLVTEKSKVAALTGRLIHAALPTEEQRLAFVDEQYEKARQAGAHLTTILDDDYPNNLRLIYNPPPFLFVRGELQPEDAFSVCVVGTRQASQRGMDQARDIAAKLVDKKVTVVAGLAKGIDTTAHTSALGSGGRTVAVIGTGILNCYPKENLQLAEQIASSGALVSQFWPTSPPTQYSFPMRNVTMSGISQGTIVVEASSTSGAKMQARLALEHGKLVFLVKSLVTEQTWARNYLKQPLAFEITDVAEVLTRLRTPERISEQTSSRLQMAMTLTA